MESTLYLNMDSAWSIVRAAVGPIELHLGVLHRTALALSTKAAAAVVIEHS
jgi:hypothetical protein